MLILASTSDKIQVVTSATGSVDVNAVWVDNDGSTVTPGRTNTPSITSATTTDVVASPASSTFRSVQYINVMNEGVGTQTISINLTDGTTVSTQWSGSLAAAECIAYENNSFVKYNSAGLPTSAPTQTQSYVDVQVFTTAGTATWTKPLSINPKQVLVKIWGAGGGGGGGASLASGTVIKGGGGGGGGAFARESYSATDLTTSVTVTVGAGGLAGTQTAGAAGGTGGQGGASSFGTYATAYGGGGGMGGQISALATGGGGGS